MRTLTFGNSKQAFLVFEAEEVAFHADGETAEGAAEFVINAQGRITRQEKIVEEILNTGRFACLLSVHENGEELLSSRYRVTFLLLEEENFVARLEVCA